MDDTFDKTIAENGKEGAHTYQLAAGSVFGMYKVIRALGRGGMGEVYEVEHEVLQKRYALKLLPSEFKTQRGFLDRFKREARVMANLEHQNIIRVEECGENDGKLWLRMEPAGGVEYKGTRVVSLSEYAEACNGRIPQDVFAEFLLQILKGLKYAHQHGVIHRDLKPTNILLTTQPATGNTQLVTVKISDFGLVRLVGEDWLKSRTEKSVSMSMSVGDMKTDGGEGEGSSTRALLGTYEYMSPEQKRGEPADERSDIYAVGLMVYKLLTGEELGMKTPSQIDKGLVSEWDELAGTALEQKPANRYSSADDMLEQLYKVKDAISGQGEKRKQDAVSSMEQAGARRK